MYIYIYGYIQQETIQSVCLSCCNKNSLNYKHLFHSSNAWQVQDHGTMAPADSVSGESSLSGS